MHANSDAFCGVQNSASIEREQLSCAKAAELVASGVVGVLRTHAREHSETIGRRQKR